MDCFQGGPLQWAVITEETDYRIYVWFDFTKDRELNYAWKIHSRDKNRRSFDSISNKGKEIKKKKKKKRERIWKSNLELDQLQSAFWSWSTNILETITFDVYNESSSRGTIVFPSNVFNELVSCSNYSAPAHLHLHRFSDPLVLYLIPIKFLANFFDVELGLILFRVHIKSTYTELIWIIPRCRLLLRKDTIENHLAPGQSAPSTRRKGFTSSRNVNRLCMLVNYRQDLSDDLLHLLFRFVLIWFQMQTGSSPWMKPLILESRQRLDKSFKDRDLFLNFANRSRVFTDNLRKKMKAIIRINWRLLNDARWFSAVNHACR